MYRPYEIFEMLKHAAIIVGEKKYRVLSTIRMFCMRFCGWRIADITIPLNGICTDFTACPMRYIHMRVDSGKDISSPIKTESIII